MNFRWFGQALSLTLAAEGEENGLLSQGLVAEFFRTASAVPGLWEGIPLGFGFPGSFVAERLNGIELGRFNRRK
jgi:hypothetical protein